MLTDADLTRMEAEHAATTQGEWEIVRRGRDGHGKRVLKVPGLEYGSCGCCGYDDIAEGADGDFCVSAHRDYPLLVAEVRRARKSEFEAQADYSAASDEVERLAAEAHRLRTALREIAACKGPCSAIAAEALDETHAA